MLSQQLGNKHVITISKYYFIGVVVIISKSIIRLLAINILSPIPKYIFLRLIVIFILLNPRIIVLLLSRDLSFCNTAHEPAKPVKHTTYKTPESQMKRVLQFGLKKMRKNKTKWKPNYNCLKINITSNSRQLITIF